VEQVRFWTIWVNDLMLYSDIVLFLKLQTAVQVARI
jgi:hypothetical protein